MPREHPTIKMTIDELLSFVGAQVRCIVGTLDAEGGPWGDAAACVLYDGALYFRVPRNSRSCANILRDNRVCCAVEDHPTGDDYYTIKGAVLHGRAAPLAEPAMAQQVVVALENLPDPVTGTRMADGAIFSIGLEDVASFDFAKIKRRFES